MFTEQMLHEYPIIIKLFMGISAELFWRIVAEVTLKLPEIDRQRLERTERKRGLGAGRTCDQPPVLRVAAVLSYLRLHIRPKW
jgi:hypothetical protein